LVTGVEATGSVGTVSVAAYSNVYPIGVQGLGKVSTPLVWGLINDGQTPNWQDVNDSQTGNWVQVVDGNTVTWVQIPT
jgi:hypothetical protein